MVSIASFHITTQHGVEQRHPRLRRRPPGGQAFLVRRRSSSLQFPPSPLHTAGSPQCSRRLDLRPRPRRVEAETMAGRVEADVTTAARAEQPASAGRAGPATPPCQGPQGRPAARHRHRSPIATRASASTSPRTGRAAGQEGLVVRPDAALRGPVASERPTSHDSSFWLGMFLRVLARLQAGHQAPRGRRDRSPDLAPRLAPTAIVVVRGPPSASRNSARPSSSFPHRRPSQFATRPASFHRSAHRHQARLDRVGRHPSQLHCSGAGQVSSAQALVGRRLGQEATARPTRRPSTPRQGRPATPPRRCPTPTAAEPAPSG